MSITSGLVFHAYLNDNAANNTVNTEVGPTGYVNNNTSDNLYVGASAGPDTYPNIGFYFSGSPDNTNTLFFEDYSEELNAIEGLTGMTWAFWVKRDNVLNPSTIDAKQSGSNPGSVWYRSLEDDGDIRTTYWVTGGSFVSYTNSHFTPTYTVPTGEWIHVGLTYQNILGDITSSGTRFYLYVSGQEVAHYFRSATNLLATGNFPLTIGGNINPADGTSSIALADYRIYNRVLDQNEMYAVYTASSGANYLPLQLQHTFGDGTGYDTYSGYRLSDESYIGTSYASESGIGYGWYNGDQDYGGTLTGDVIYDTLGSYSASITNDINAFCFWFNTTGAVTRDQYLFHIRNNPGDAPYRPFIEVLVNNTGALECIVYKTTTPTPTSFAHFTPTIHTTGGFVADGNRHHVAITISHSGSSSNPFDFGLYLDNETVVETIGQITYLGNMGEYVFNQNRDLNLVVPGREDYFSDFTSIVTLDDVRFYNDDFVTGYNIGPGFVNYVYGLQDDTSTTCLDHSGYIFTGFINPTGNVVTKSIGTAPCRDYNSIMDWLNSLTGASYATGDTAVGVCYNDGPLYENLGTLTYNTAQRANMPHDIYLTAHENSRHSGDISGGVVVYTDKEFRFWNQDKSLSIEWLNFDLSLCTGYNSSYSIFEMKLFGGNNYLRNCIFRNFSSLAPAPLYFMSHSNRENNGDVTGFVYNNLFYNIVNNTASSIGYTYVSAAYFNTFLMYNNTFHKCLGGDVVGISIEGDAVAYFINNIISDSGHVEFGHSFGPNIDLDEVLHSYNNATFDSSATGGQFWTGYNSLTGILNQDLYVSTGSGSEDFNLVETSPAYNYGLVTGVITDLGSLFTNDIQGIQRGDTWNVGAYDLTGSDVSEVNVYMTGISNTVTSSIGTIYVNRDFYGISNTVTDTSGTFTIDGITYVYLSGVSETVTDTIASIYVDRDFAGISNTVTDSQGDIYNSITLSGISNTVTDLIGDISNNLNNGEIFNITVYLTTGQAFDVYIQTGYNSTHYINTGISYELY